MVSHYVDVVSPLPPFPMYEHHCEHHNWPLSLITILPRGFSYSMDTQNTSKLLPQNIILNLPFTQCGCYRFFILLSPFAVFLIWALLKPSNIEKSSSMDGVILIGWPLLLKAECQWFYCFVHIPHPDCTRSTWTTNFLNYQL